PPGNDRVPVVELSEEAWDEVLDTNLKGTYLVAKAVARAMIGQRVRGRIITMASDFGKVGQPERAAYCASKFAVIGFTQSLARELGPAGITVNALCPGTVDTNRIDYIGRTPDGTFDAALRAEGAARLAKRVPLGRLATVEDVAGYALFLASDAASYVTGQALNVGGGEVMH
ncbi:MAG: SDR family oxidoreductase, partial [Alphaproteobacteria bacterium]